MDLFFSVLFIFYTDRSQQVLLILLWQLESPLPFHCLSLWVLCEPGFAQAREEM